MYSIFSTRIILHSATILATTAIVITACNTGKENTGKDVDTAQYQLATDAGPGQDASIQLTPQVITYQGATYSIAVSRTPSDTLPLIKDSYGDPYKDNVVHISVTRDGEPCLSRQFVKTDFAAAARDININTLTLGGMAFSRLDADGYHFGAQLCSPGDVEGGYAFSVTLPLGGGAPTIVRDNNATAMNEEMAE